MFAVPVKIRKRRRARRHTDPKLVLPDDRDVNNPISRDSENGRNVCECCWSHKTRYDNVGVEEQLPPPPSPPQLKEAAQLDGVPRPNSVDRILHSDNIQHISHEALNKMRTICGEVEIFV
ncbi:disks large 1 tumor suppressor protein [Lasius niger]|uniref:Disks large 1 tumor suppressor protein n=1 Tax=Lasius niger TaxID=67767 RepID=A0A0J7LBW6_LASNI|nr:disks large 1 tumor suppressor protein [Lasius niger]